MKVIVINEYDRDDESNDTIGVASSIEEANDIISRYYGSYIIKENFDYEYEYGNVLKHIILDVEGFGNKRYIVDIHLLTFEIDKI